MAENKKSIVVYADWIHVFEAMDEAEAGRLIKHFFRYVNDLNPNPPDRLTQIAFEPIKQQLKRDLVKWNETTTKLSESGRNGGIKSGETRKQKAEAKRSEASKNEAFEAVNVTVNDNVKVKEVLSIVDRKSRFATTLNDYLSDYGKDFLNDFFSYWTEPNKSNTKFRQEMEKTWDLERRLKTWEKNDKKFNKNNNGKFTDKPSKATTTINNALELLHESGLTLEQSIPKTKF